ncbi:414_t:CDS:1 [Funneliformis geosporum]|uniref:18609_t:CDS:1 n=1 Tax=Funneliformis geosporum TaxID=1117311 RepID=A0A9W4SR58_9GLOM|nr:414_t:CDS:1 [Funneliformis geosporum]CAI2178591.1 18609_t:CDS:1 [Funneliformis geosporum]
MSSNIYLSATSSRTMSNYSMTTNDLRQKCTVLRERIEVIKKEGSELLEEIMKNVSEEELELCLQNVGNLEANLKNTYETVEEQNDEILRIVISRIEELEDRLSEVELQLKLQANETKFFSFYRDWVKYFMNMIIDKLGERKWRLADVGLDFKRKNLELTKEEKESIKDLKDLLSDVGMTTDDMKLLQDVTDRSNAKFHRNNQTLEEAKMKLCDPVPGDIQVYKPSLHKALEAISKWRKS